MEKQPDISIIQNLGRVRTSPFPFAKMASALPDAIYEELERSFPSDLVRQWGIYYESCYNLEQKGADGDLGIYRFKSVHAAERELPPIWRDFFDYHTSEAFFRAVVDLFEEPLSQLYPQYMDLFRNGEVNTRGISEGTDLVTDCQFVVNDPIPDGFTSRTAHLDSPVEIYACLLYMRRPEDSSQGGNLAVYRPLEAI